jgi:nicotinamidase-related amidase
MRVTANYYQQYDADLSREVPGEGYAGWQRADIEVGRAALVVMHAWDTGTPEQFPGWHRAVEYMPRAERICREVFPPLLSAARQADFPVLHVVGGGDYYSHLPGYQHARALATLTPAPAVRAVPDEAVIGRHNEVDVRAGFARLDFPEEARPCGSEGVAEDADQLAALCTERGVNHLVYIGFALNWCLLMSPGGMLDMSRRGFLCSTIRQATTCVENRETAREELNKQEALWRVALAFGFVFDIDDFVSGLRDGGTVD